MAGEKRAKKTKKAKETGVPQRPPENLVIRDRKLQDSSQMRWKNYLKTHLLGARCHQIARDRSFMRLRNLICLLANFLFTCINLIHFLHRVSAMAMEQKIAELSSQLQASEERERRRDMQFDGMRAQLDELLASRGIPSCPDDARNPHTQSSGADDDGTHVSNTQRHV
ncbi:uncharacterized protein LOC132622882 [Lycium barbarum]|uniref:uncharacterized protein LOC132622882 n=1 Tax=Lycium barbarum TaxID=112863 RepID=UPI00293E37FE|nr:uncharacterized protein LOC132622882 [Lycium barbarum]